MINKVTLIGNLGRDPEIRHLESGAVVGKFSVATNENYKDKAGEWKTITEWHEVIVWRGLAERAERDLKKGSLCYIDGKITHRKYQDKDGVERNVTEIVANAIRPLEKRESSGNKMNDNFPSVESPGMNTPATPAPGKVEAPGPIQADDDDLPF